MRNTKAILDDHPTMFTPTGFTRAQAAGEIPADQPDRSVPDSKTELEPITFRYTIDYCINEIKNEKFIWDMRFWNFTHDQGEVELWVLTIYNNGPSADIKNCGHAAFCIHTLLIYHSYEPYKIIDLIMENKEVTYRDQIGTMTNPLILNKPMKSTCKQCQTAIQYIRTVNGKLMPAGMTLTTLENARQLKPGMKFLITASGETRTLPESVGFIPHWAVL